MPKTFKQRVKDLLKEIMFFRTADAVEGIPFWDNTNSKWVYKSNGTVYDMNTNTQALSTISSLSADLDVTSVTPGTSKEDLLVIDTTALSALVGKTIEIDITFDMLAANTITFVHEITMDAGTVTATDGTIDYVGAVGAQQFVSTWRIVFGADTVHVTVKGGVVGAAQVLTETLFDKFTALPTADITITHHQDSGAAQAVTYTQIQAKIY